MAGIDFLGIAKGEQLGLDMNWQDALRAEQQKINDYNDKSRVQQGIVRDQTFVTQQAGQEAATYLAPLLSYKQRYTDSGGSDVDWLLNQKQTITQDPNFLNKTPEVQQEILKALTVNGQMLADQYMKQGDPATAQKILGAFGNNAAINPLDNAIRTGDPDQILAAVNLKADANGMVDIGGQLVPKLEVASGILKEHSKSGVLPTALQAYRNGVAENTAKTAAQQLVDQQGAAQYQNNLTTLMGSGYTKGADGVLSSADGKQRLTLDPKTGTMNFAGPATSVVPATGGSQAAVTSPAGVAGSATPSIVPLPNGALPNATPSEPLAQLRTTLEQLPKIQTALQAAQQQVLATRAAKDQLIASNIGTDNIVEKFSNRGVVEDRVNALNDLLAQQEKQQKALESQYGTLLLQHRELNGQLGAQQTSATAIGDELVRGYTTIGLDPTKAADFIRKYPAQIAGVVSSLQAEIKRVEARSTAAATPEEKAALLAYAQRVGNAILNLNRKQ